MKKVITFIAALSFTVLISYAHEGHHDEGLKSPHGGVMHETKSFHLEVVQEALLLKLYPYDSDVKPLSISEVRIQGVVRPPSVGSRKTVKPRELQFKTGKDYFETKISDDGKYRYSIDLSLSHKGKSENLVFQIEP